MTHPDLHHARLAALSQSLRDLLAESRRVVSPEPALELAMLQAEYALAIDEQAEPIPEVPRDLLCLKHPWCVAERGHVGTCTRGAPKREMPRHDFGPAAAKGRRW